MPSIAIQVTDLGMTYSDGTETVRNVSLEIPAGEFFGFLGPNGAGKTTVIRMLTTLLQPTTGRITVNGYDVQMDSQSVRQSIGYMAQETVVEPTLTVRENISLACRAYGVPRDERDDRIDDLLDLFDLASKADTPAQTLSGGQQKRLDAATALVHEPPIVFLDEPTTGLDPAARNRLWEYFREINRRGTTVFLTTQYLQEADALCSSLAVIQEGEIVATGSPADLKARVGGDVLELSLDEPSGATVDRARTVIEELGVLAPEETESIQSTPDGLDVTSARAGTIAPDLLTMLSEAGIILTGFTVRSPTLDDVFLAITDGSTRDTTNDLREDDERVEERR
ncbi:daunorubicin ABC transporter ATP-binding protein [halophilic archaeon]|nr:daunorubicin ABC transporter ATP-binding protein [halophilic archaeon]